MQVHLHVGAVTDAVSGSAGAVSGAAGAGVGPVARVTGGGISGARAIESVQRWITGLRPDAVLTVTPVVDLTEHIAVDAYEAPRRLTEQLEHRDLTCRFPWCPRTGSPTGSGTGSLDKDHIVAFQFQELDFCG